MDNITHHLVPKRAGGTKDNPSFKHVCCYCGRTEKDLRDTGNGVQPTHQICDQAPR